VAEEADSVVAVLGAEGLAEVDLVVEGLEVAAVEAAGAGISAGSIRGNRTERSSGLEAIRVSMRSRLRCADSLRISRRMGRIDLG
jgi:hypothetical protein